MPAVFNRPDETKRTVILGRTGAGKTVGAMDLFSGQNWHEMPWVLFDFKEDPMIVELEEQNKGRIKVIKITDNPPKKPGIYIVRPLPDDDDANVEVFLKKCWSQQNIGIYIDEGYMIHESSRALKAILTQGRSRHVPLILLYQRPVYMSRFAIAQADFFMAYDQNDERDLKTTASFVKPAENGISVYDTLPKHYRLWYDVSQGETLVLKPAPPPDVILQRFRERLQPRKRRGLI